MRKDTMINIELITDIDIIYRMVRSITKNIPEYGGYSSSVRYILGPKYVFRLAIHKLRMDGHTDVSVGTIYSTIGTIYEILPYIITTYDDNYTTETNDRYQFEIKNLLFFVFKFYEEIMKDEELENELCYRIHKYSKDIIPEPFDPGKGLSYYLGLLDLDK